MKKVYKKNHIAFCTRIKALRKSKKITQIELAGRMDVDVKTIKRIEKGIYNPSLSIVFALAEALDIKVKDLLDF